MEECTLSYQWIPQRNPYRPGQSEMIIQHAEKEKKKKSQARILYLATLTLKYEGEIETFLDKN